MSSFTGSLDEGQWADVMLGKWYGPYEPEMFLEKLMPLSKPVLNKMRQDVEFRAPACHENGTKGCEDFEATVKAYNLSPKAKYCLMSHGPRNMSGGSQPPGDDLCHGKCKAESATVYPHTFDWSSDRLVIEYEESPKVNPFWSAAVIQETAAKRHGDALHKKICFERNKPIGATQARGQMAHCATLAFSHQYRTHLFQLLVCGQYARFFYWDHSGAIVSDLFDYVENASILAQFFWRYSHMSDAKRGLDSSVTVASDEEKRVFREAMKRFLEDMIDVGNPRRLLPHAEDTLNEEYPIVKVTVKDDVSKECCKVLIQAPFFCHRFAVSRATRGYLAYHLARKELVFFKDTWRIEHVGLTAERAIFHRLCDAGVQFVPEVLLGGDVMVNGKRSLTRCSEWVELLALDVAHDQPKDHRHHRLLQPLAYPIQAALNSREAVIAFRDCLRAIESANAHCDLLHRDISLHNVMIKLVQDGDIFGILADWELAGPVSSNTNLRMGTWQSMSIARLTDPRKPHDLLDDLEALFWSLLHGSIKHYRHENRLPVPVLQDVFDERRTVVLKDGTVAQVGGEKKYRLLQTIDVERPRRSAMVFASRPLDGLLRRMAGLWCEYYDLVFLVARAESGEPERDRPTPHSEDANASAADVDDDSQAKDTFKADSATEHSEGIEDPLLARRELDMLRDRLSKPSTWLRLFDEAIDSPDWTIDDKQPSQDTDMDSLERRVKDAIEKLRQSLLGDGAPECLVSESELGADEETVEGDVGEDEDGSTANDDATTLDSNSNSNPCKERSGVRPPRTKPAPTPTPDTQATSSPRKTRSSTRKAAEAPAKLNPSPTDTAGEASKLTDSDSDPDSQSKSKSKSKSKQPKNTTTTTTTTTAQTNANVEHEVRASRRDGLRPVHVVKYTA